jgi:hypothetical protein
MLYEPYYIVTGRFLEESIDSCRNRTFVLEMDIRNVDGIRREYVTASKLPESSSFFLFLNGENADNDKWANEIISFFFIPNYRKIKDAPTVLFAPVSSIEKTIKMFRECIKAQGFAEPEIIYVNTGRANGINIFDATDTEKIKLYYRDLLSGVAETFDSIYIRVSRKEDIDLVHEFLQGQENEYKKQNNDLFLMKARNKLLKKQLTHSELIMQAAQREIQILSSHIDTLRSTSQATHIQNYYNNEYEAMPRWYKRFGHILKFFMGKRTFRSLFDKSAKKYKD